MLSYHSNWILLLFRDITLWTIWVNKMTLLSITSCGMLRKFNKPFGKVVENWPKQSLTLENCQIVFYHPPLPTFKCHPNLVLSVRKNLYLTFKYTWTSLLSKTNKRIALVRTKTSNYNRKQRRNNHNFESLYSMFVNRHICVILWSSVHLIDSSNCPKVMHNPNGLKS